ncbi:PIR Superfamily Protein [Plasmodium malariae]|nr:PIR Superfamily Protein [Plasmodium malariae]
MEKEEEVYENILKVLPSFKIYTELNKEENDGQYKNFCNNFNSIEEKYKDESIKLCKKVARNLGILSKVSNLKDFYNHCSYYKFWIYRELWKILNSMQNKDVDVLSAKFGNLQKSLSDYYNIRTCNYKLDHITLEELKEKSKEKHLYVYFTNYENIKSKDICNEVEYSKYKEYLTSILNLYNIKKKTCCNSRISVCPNYFLNCDEKLDPSKILDELNSKYNNCNDLKSITIETIAKESDTTISDPEFLNSIYFTNCPFKDKVNHSSCTLIRGYINPPSSEIANGNNSHQETHISSIVGADISRSSTYSAKLLSEKIRNKGGYNIPEEHDKLSLNRSTGNEFRWNFADGGLQCKSKSSETDKYGLCKYMEELVEDEFFIKREDSMGYKFKMGEKWSPEEIISSVRKKRQNISGRTVPLQLRDLRSAQTLNPSKILNTGIMSSYGEAFPGTNTESNILHNTFYRISMAFALVMGIIFIFFLYFKFTPFGSCLGKTKKKKKRYRTNFDELNTQRIPRRFIKRTYRNSNRRRFSVVNIEQ